MRDEDAREPDPDAVLVDPEWLASRYVDPRTGAGPLPDEVQSVLDAHDWRLFPWRSSDSVDIAVFYEEVEAWERQRPARPWLDAERKVAVGPGPKKLTADESREVRASYRGGQSITMLARTWGIQRKSVKWIISGRKARTG